MVYEKVGQSRDPYKHRGIFRIVPPKWNEKATCEKHAHPDQVASLEVAKEEFEATRKVWKAWVNWKSAVAVLKGDFRWQRNENRNERSPKPRDSKTTAKPREARCLRTR